MKEKIIVFGLGNYFKNFEDLILKKFDVIALSDNTKPDTIIPKHIYPREIMSRDFDKILISTDRYYPVIRTQLLGMGIPIEKIMNIMAAVGDDVVGKWSDECRRIPPPPIYKQVTICKYAKTNGAKYFVESGTFMGEMISAQLENFEKLASIELSKELWQDARAKFSHISKVKLYNGDSSKIFGNVIREILSPEEYLHNILFYLDGHYSGGSTAKGEKNTPIIEELNHIFSFPMKNGVTIIIDDARLFTGHEDYPDIEELETFINKNSPVRDYSFENLDDMIRIVFNANAV